jgi:molecular chaperone DnaK (HSP70)/uncharacterized protein YegL
MGITVGIDLGTTNSVVARVNQAGRPEVIFNDEGSPITPSVICFRDGEVVVGAEAKELQALGTYPVAAMFKRQMGDEDFIFAVDGHDYSATELSSILLSKLKTGAEATLGQPIEQAIITVPAYFRDPERKATIAAGEAAGLRVIQVINEPTAAAIAYGLGSAAEDERILVYDLGGGTFDVTLLESSSAGLRVLTSAGDHQLGGKDWDDRIIEFLATSFEEEFGVDPLEEAETVADLLVLTERAKKQLTDLSKTRLTISHQGNRGRYLLDRDTLERITNDLMERTISLTESALEDVGLTASQVGSVVLVGGSTRMPMVHKFVERYFGQPPKTGVNVDEAVALGAALMAEQQTRRAAKTSLMGLPGPTRVVDVTNHSLGMIAINGDQSAYLNSIIIPKNTQIPSELTRPYQHRTRQHGDNRLEVFMTQGESDSPGDVVYLGKYVIADVTWEQGGLTIIDVGYHYDVSGTVQVTGRASRTGQPLRVTVEPLPPDVPDRFLRPPQLNQVPEHLTAYLAFDLSGSMSGSPLSEAKKAAIGFLDNTDLTHCSLGIIGFSDQVKVKLAACQNARQIQAAIGGLTVGETGGCNGADPFDEVQSRLGGLEGRRIAVVLADGVWNDQRRAVKRAKACHAQGIDVIAIGFGGADRQFLRDIASSDEASFFTTLNGLVETFSTIAQEITQSGGGLTMLDEGRSSRR